VVKHLNNREQPLMNWDAFEKHMKKQFPFLSDSSWLKSVDQPLKRVENYVQKTMKSFFAGDPVSQQTSFNPSTANDIDYNMFETHHSLFVHCRIPEELPLNDVRYYVNKRKLKIEHSGKSKEIALTSTVNPSRATAKIKGGILEIRMPKSKDSEPFREIPIRDR
jgi:HSP20 family molecular chaperone IbpA